MKNQIKITALLFLLSFVISCESQENTNKASEKIIQTKSIENKSQQKDPYFTESKAINSPYGPTNITRNIIQDRNGIFWLATWEGIIQYNGQNFINITNKEGLEPFRVFTILEDRTGNIWFGTVGGGIYLYDGISFTNITTKDGLVNDSIGCFMEDKAGNIWIGTQDGISKYDGKTFTNFEIEGGQTNNDVNSIVEDKTGKLWIGTRGEVSLYDGKAFTKFRNNGVPFVNVRSVLKDTKGNIWLGGSNGLWSYNGNSFRNLTTNFVGYIYEDKKGNIWTSSAANSDGNSHDWMLSRYDAQSPLNVEAVPTQVKAADDMFFGIMEDDAGKIWWGSLEGVHRYNGVSFEDFKEVKEMNFKID